MYSPIAGYRLELARRGLRVAGVDLSEPMLRIARARAARMGVGVHLVRADGSALPFRDGAFDLVTLILGLEFAADPGRTLEETRRILRPGGRAVQFPINLKPTTTPFMGDPSARVSIWHWRADGKAENLIAAGFGSLTPASVQDVRATGVRTSRGWEVVITRPLRTASEDGVRFDGVREIPVAFAVWNGSTQERCGKDRARHRAFAPQRARM